MTELKIDPELNDALARQQTVDHIVHTLQQLPDGWIVGFQAPGFRPLSAGSGAVGPNGSWNFYVRYWVWGYDDMPSDDVFDMFTETWDSWGWIDSVQSDNPRKRSAYGQTPDGYRFDIRRGVHGGVSMGWMSPYYPASGSAYGGVMPSIITKDGPQSYEQPQRE
ncbi:hypothetical protein [Mycolicibacterium sp.]|uniref:hypothetical protein n=1 Tax=Mycolicibacterium sp. TaxID=2320850 RepID=UPI0037C80D67